MIDAEKNVSAHRFNLYNTYKCVVVFLNIFILDQIISIVNSNLLIFENA